MEFLSVAFLPLLVIATAVVVYFRCPGFYRSTKEYFRSFSNNKSGQDLVEYSLMTGFVAVAAGAIIPGVAKAVKIVFFKACAAVDGKAYIASISTDATGWRIACGLLAVVLVAIILLRRQRYERHDKGGHW